MDFGSLFTDMQAKLEDVKVRLEAARLEHEMGGVRVVVTGKKKIEEVQIAPDLLVAERREELEDLLVTAVNRALGKADAKAAEEMHAVTGGMLPPGMGLPGL